MYVWRGTLIMTHVLMIWCIITRAHVYVSYFECVPVGVEHIECDFDVLLDALASPLELPPLQGQIQVIACVT